MRRAQWAYLLEDNPNFKRWYENLSRGSLGTAKERARVLYRFLKFHDLTPQRLLDLAVEDRPQVEDVLMDFVAKLHNDGKSPGYIENYIKAVRSWLKFNGVELVRSINIGNRKETPTISDERVPTKNELRQILNYAGERGRCSIALMAFAGLRPQVLGNINGVDGLELRDLPEIKIEDREVTFEKTPTRIIVRPNLSKAKHRYFTFINEEGCEYLKAYLEKRLAAGEELNRHSSIIAVKIGYEETGFPGKRNTNHLTTKTVTKEIRDAMRPKYTWRPYVLRAYFDTQLMVAENHGKISHPYRQFFMGHAGDMEATYTTNKGRLPQEVIEDMRQTFGKCEEYLSTTPSRFNVDLEKAKIESLLSFAKLQGLPEEKIDSIRQILTESENPTADKAIELLSGYANLKAIFWVKNQSTDATPQTKSGETNQAISKKERPFEAQIVTESELTDFLECGFDLVANIGDGKFVVRRKNHGM